MEPSFFKSLACVARRSSQLKRKKRAAKPLERVGERNAPRGEWEGEKEKNACPKARLFWGLLFLSAAVRGRVFLLAQT